MMKHLTVFAFILLFSLPLLAQEGELNSCHFDTSAINLSVFFSYDRIDPALIRDTRLTVVEIKKDDPQNACLFYPMQKTDSTFNLFHIINWALKKKILPAYTYYDISFVDWDFEKLLRDSESIPYNNYVEDLNRSNGFFMDDPELMNHYDDRVLASFMILESTILGENNVTLAKRPLMIAPIFTRDTYTKDKDKTGRQERLNPYWVSFNKLAEVLKAAKPALPVDGAGNLQEFFLKNRYGAENITYDFTLRAGTYWESRPFSTSRADENWKELARSRAVYIYPPTEFLVYGTTTGNDDSGFKEPPINFERPDLEAAASAREYSYILDRHNGFNESLFIPSTKLFGIRNLGEILFEGLQTEELLVVDEEDHPISFKNYAGSLNLIDTLYGDDGKLLKIMVNTQYISSYRITGLAFFDENENFLYKEPIKITPMVYQWGKDDLKESGDILIDPWFLSRYYVYRDLPDLPDSFYSLLTKEKFFVSNVKDKPVPLGRAKESLLREKD